MQNIKLPYGVKTLDFQGHLIVYTCKIRVQCNYETVAHLAKIMQVVAGRNGCYILSYATTNRMDHESNYSSIKRVLANIMHDRIERKYYGELVNTAEMMNDLPF